MRKKFCEWCERIGRWCEYPLRGFKFFFNLLFLPEHIRKWLFIKGTRTLELLNALALMWWGVVFIDSKGIKALPSYSGFTDLPYEWVAAGFMGLGLAILICLPIRSPRWNILSGFFMEGAALVWALVGLAFWQGYPPLNTAMMLYPLLSILNLWAGETMIDSAKEEILVNKRGGDKWNG